MFTASDGGLTPAPWAPEPDASSWLGAHWAACAWHYGVSEAGAKLHTLCCLQSEQGLGQLAELVFNPTWHKTTLRSNRTVSHAIRGKKAENLCGHWCSQSLLYCCSAPCVIIVNPVKWKSSASVQSGSIWHLLYISAKCWELGSQAKAANIVQVSVLLDWSLQLPRLQA